MKMISLGLLVDMKYISRVKVLPTPMTVGSDVEALIMTDGYSFDVGSPEFEEKKRWIVKGDYLIEEDKEDRTNVLVVTKLEKDIDVSINKPAIVAEGVAPEDATLEEYINTPVTAVVFHRSLLISSARDTKKKFVTAYAEACIESYQKQNPLATREDFAVIEIDWSNKHIELKKISDK